ncbi:MAG: carboxypeptidase regulatory-like domain-containing protein [Acidimicrobiales bacterium]
MHVQLAQRTVDVTPGVPVELTLEVFNPDVYIDGVTARVLHGLSPEWVECEPWQLSLFPQTGGVLRVRLTIPPSFPAGEHVVSLEVKSTVDPTKSEMFDLVLSVPEESAGGLALEPTQITGGGKARFDVVCHNTGNVRLELALTAHNPEGALQFRFEPSFFAIPVGAEGRVSLFVEGRRPRVGQPVARPITVQATDVEHQLVASGTFHQRPWIPRGFITAAILAGIVGIWAAVVYFGVQGVLGQEPLTKAAPLSLSRHGRVGELDPAAVAASAAGRVSASASGQGVARVTVEAHRRIRNGGLRLASSAATNEEGDFELGRLLPGTYFFRFTAPGYVDVWYPAAPDPASGTPVKLAPEAKEDGINATIQGLPGSITGQVEAGSAESPAPVTVRIRGAAPTTEGQEPYSAVAGTDGEGTFSFKALATPASYQLTFEAAGFKPQTADLTLGGGQNLVANTIRLSAGPGTITGTITDGISPLGGVKITATSGSVTVQTASPTTGQIGTFTIADVPTPGTYLITFDKEGFGTQSIALDLAAGESRSGVDVVMVGGTGSIVGRVTDGTNGLGDVTVEVLGGPSATQTKTLTAAGQQGSYRITGLPTPGTYTVTFAKPGYTSTTLGVTLDASGRATGVDAVLRPSAAAVSGNVVGPDTPIDTDLEPDPMLNATVELGDGATTRSTITTATPTAGGFRLTGLAPGIYTITVTAPGFASFVQVIQLQPGENAQPVITLVKA